ncbi:MAG: diguanylate cyclase (GGDEF)-like protein [Methylophilaceae bacterium]
MYKKLRKTNSQQKIAHSKLKGSFNVRLNDGYGHSSGDDCLKKALRTINKQIKRPGDLCARYGGKEFAIVLGSTSPQAALSIASELLDAIRDLKMPNIDSAILPIITSNIGLITTSLTKPK